MSNSVGVSVTPSVTLRAWRTTVHPGYGDPLLVTVIPATGGELVRLQLHRLGHWQTLLSGPLATTGHAIFYLTAGATNMVLRAVVAASSTHNRATSKVVRVTVR